jgi:hypothetical protein
MDPDPTNQPEWEWLSAHAIRANFRVTNWPHNSPEKAWRIEAPDAKGRMQWHYGPSLRDAVKAAIQADAELAARDAS